MSIELKQIKKVFFLGIGGIGVSALARMFLSEGKEVFGSDTSESLITEELRKLGATISIGQDVSFIPTDTDLVVYTIAITDFAPDFFKEVASKFKTLSYPEVLGLISKDKYTIAIAGTHGKTTTTAMTAEALIANGKKPTVIVGSLLSKYKSNYIKGEGDLFVVEACEYEKSFLHIHAKVAIVTNIDNDHLDFYGSLENVIKAFNEFLRQVPGDGFIICDKTNDRVKEALVGVVAKVIDVNDFYDENILLSVSGNHNRYNASTVLALSSILNLDEGKTREGLKGFSGTWRRFEYKGETKEGAKVYDDYAHHPTEIKATLQGARELCKDGKIFVIFEPHLFSRTKLLLDEFTESFGEADEVVITPIYPAREEFDPSISSEMLVGRVNNTKARYEDSYQSAIDYINEIAQKGDIVMVLGAGKVTEVSKGLVK